MQTPPHYAPALPRGRTGGRAALTLCGRTRRARRGRTCCRAHRDERIGAWDATASPARVRAATARRARSSASARAGRFCPSARPGRFCPSARPGRSCRSDPSARYSRLHRRRASARCCQLPPAGPSAPTGRASQSRRVSTTMPQTARPGTARPGTAQAGRARAGTARAGRGANAHGAVPLPAIGLAAVLRPLSTGCCGSAARGTAPRGQAVRVLSAASRPSSATEVSRILNFCTLPVTVIGNSSVIRTYRGIL